MSAPHAFHAYRVGAPYIPGRTTFPELVQYNYRGGAHELLMWLPALTRHEIEDVRRGTAQFALVVRQPVILLLYRFGESIPWSDAPFDLQRVHEDERSVPPSTNSEDPHALLQIILVEASTGIVKALRVIGFNPAFTTALHLAIQAQAALSYTAAEYEQTLAALYHDHSSAALRDIAIAHHPAQSQ